MSLASANLALRFLLELAGLAAMAYWGWTTHGAPWRVVWAAGLPLAAGALWGALRVPGDPRDAPIAVPGPMRLLLEMAFFGAATWLLAAAGWPSLALILGAAVACHYLASYRRVAWLLAQR
jgi:hypothetical protein